MAESKHTPAVMTALAYVYATGEFPAGIQGSTRHALFELTEWRELTKRLKPEVLDAVRAHPYAVAHDYLVALGYRPERRGRPMTSHYVAYRHPETGWEAGASRSGYVWITQVNDHRPYRVKVADLSPSDVRAAIAKAEGSE